MRSAACLFVLMVGLVAPNAHADEPAQNELPPAAPVENKAHSAPIDLSIMGGIGGGFSLLAGSVGEAVGPAGQFGLEAGARFLNHLYATALFDLTLFSEGKQSAKNVSSWLLGVRGGWLTNANGFGAFGDLGVGYRSTSIADTNGTSLSRGGADLLVGLGLHFKVGDNIRLFLPRVDMALGSAGGDVHALFTFGLVAMFNFDVGRRSHHE
jgi:hypothetical protein